MHKSLTMVGMIILLVSSGVFGTLFQDWKLTEDYSIKFSTPKAEGTFTGLKGDIFFSPEDLTTARFDVTVDATTIDTGNRLKNKHARKEAWFNVADYPTIEFESTQVTQSGSRYLASGQLTIKGIQKPVDVPFSFVPDDEGGIFTGTFSIKREDFGLDGPFLFGGLVGDVVEVNLRIPVAR